ncbi:MAG: hypothetical protein EA397_11825 [Deltaproteobacteria bacterium]|nr:MAG: hypothetical protein EA397_11825 [Deltaproteobacteria bacterium]
MPDHATQGTLRIVLTGGPGGGKTTVATTLQGLDPDRFALVPEAASLLFSGGFPRDESPWAARPTQRAIFHVQRNLEDLQAARFPDRVLLCDRGSLDGTAYWPDTAEDFFTSLGSTLADELRRYDAVVFFETAAAGSSWRAGNTLARPESAAVARTLDARLREIWSQHPRFLLVPATQAFSRKVEAGVAALRGVIATLQREPTEHRG